MSALWVILGFGAVILLAGGGVCRAFGLKHLGIGIALALAAWLVSVLAIAMPLGWHAHWGDAALLVLLLSVGIVGWRRSGQVLPAYRPLDIVFFLVVLVGFSLPALVLPVPLDTDAQGFGYLALTAREAGDLTRLAPYQPDVAYLYAPGFTVLVAYISERLGTPLHTTQSGAAAVLATALVMVLYDLGDSISGKAQARGTALAALVGTGLLTAYMDAHYTSVIGLLLGAAFLHQSYHFAVATPPRTAQQDRQHLAAIALLLAALVLVHPDTTIIIALGYGAWLLGLPFSAQRPPRWRWLALVFGVPVLAVVLFSPWLLTVLHLLGGDIVSPFARDITYWRVALGVPPQALYHGLLILPLALIGAAAGIRQRSSAALMAVGWVLLVLEFAAFGILERLAPALIAPLVRYDYPFSIAWHGPIVPFSLLGGMGMVWLWRWISGDGKRYLKAARRLAWAGIATGMLGLLLLGIFNRQVLAFSKGRITFFGAFASHADVAAMTWLRQNTPETALVLNFPGPQEGDWVPVIAERQAVYYRPQPFFQTGTADPLADTPQQAALRAFWEHPADAANPPLLQAHGVDYVIVPQIVGNPASFQTMFRWRAPFTEQLRMQSAVQDAPYLTLVFDQDGAQVYRVKETP